MLSKLVLKQGSFSAVLRSDVSNRLCLIGVRLLSAGPPATTSPPPTSVASSETDLKKTVANWDYANQLFYSPQRDHKNFPILKQQDICPPVRLGFIPETWFQTLYDKTGVTGPYATGIGLIAFLMSKEIVIVEHHFAHFIAFWIAFYILYKKFGKMLAEMIDKRGEALSERHHLKPMRRTREGCEKIVKELEKSIWREEGQKYLYNAKKENVDLQLESHYRQRLAEAYQVVKRRLDYHSEIESLQKRVEQQHMVDWITKNVVGSITSQQEKDSIVKCIADLKALAAKQKLATA